jgi:di/tricarboxylate transporter
MNMERFGTDPSRTDDELLAAIKQGALDTSAGTGRPELIGAILAPFAGLLVKLSRDAAAASEKLERLTRRLYAVTIILLLVTVLLLLWDVSHVVR